MLFELFGVEVVVEGVLVEVFCEEVLGFVEAVLLFDAEGLSSDCELSEVLLVSSLVVASVDSTDELPATTELFEAVSSPPQAVRQKTIITAINSAIVLLSVFFILLLLF